MKVPDMENPPQINTNITNTKKQIDKDDKTQISSFCVEEEHNKFTLELIDREFIKDDDTQIFYDDNLFKELLGDGNLYKALLTIIHYIILRVINRKFKNEVVNAIRNKYDYFKNSIISNINMLNNQVHDLWDDEEVDLYV